MTDPWPAIATRLEPGLGAVAAPANYLVGRPCGRAGLPDSILLFVRQDLRADTTAITHHHRHVLILALAGAGSVCIDRHVHHLRPGRAVLILPHQLHHYADIRPPLRWLFVTFEQDTLAWRALFNRQAALHPDQEALVARLLALSADPRPEAAERLGLVLALLLGELAERALPAPDQRAAGPDAARTDLLGEVNRILYDRLEDPPGIAALAAELGLSPSHLRWQIRRSLGLSLGQYMLRVRLNQARMLLRDPRLAVAQVARRCGFASPQSFSRAFRRMDGRPPRAARRPAGGG